MKRALLVVLVGAAFGGGFGYSRWSQKSATAAKPSKRKVLYWVDPMHPAYKSDKPGIAPDCNMALTPVYEGDEKAGGEKYPAGTVQVTAEKQQLIGVEFGTAQYENLADSVRVPARVVLDETRIAKVQSRLEGWIDQVFVDFTGKFVQKGEPLIALYSPDALATEQEYLLAIKAERLMSGSAMPEMMGSAGNLVAAARKRLELWDLNEHQIEEIARTGQPLKNLRVDAPISGFVMERNAFLKQHVTPETALYTLADLSSVWVIADVFEYEAANVKLNAAASLTLAYLPGKVFHGRVSYILPQVDPGTRTLKVRIQFDNPGYALKPEMYGEVQLSTGGARKLVVPQTAVLNSGDRQVVFLDRGNGYFEPRVVQMGAQTDGRVEILSGLVAGDRIVTSGNFLLDSESRLK